MDQVNLEWLLTETATRRHSPGSTDSIVKPNNSEFPDLGGRGSMSRRYGPGDTWPRHQKPWWNEALAEAQAAGWDADYIDAPHKFGVFSARARTTAAAQFHGRQDRPRWRNEVEEARKLVRRCQHGSTLAGSKVRVRQEECERLLHEAERLISIADAGADHGGGPRGRLGGSGAA